MSSTTHANGSDHSVARRKPQPAAASPAPEEGRAAPVLMAEQCLTAARAGALVMAAKGDLHLEQGGGAVLAAGKDIQVVNGGGGVLSAGRDAQISGGSCLLASAGRDVTVERGTVGIVFGRHVTLGPNTRVLIDLSPRKVFALLEALVMLPVSAVLSMLPNEKTGETGGETGGDTAGEITSAPG